MKSVSQNASAVTLSPVVAVTKAQLPQVDVRAALLARRIYHSAPQHSADLRWQWCPQPDIAALAIVTLRSGDERIALTLDSCLPLDAHSTFDWRTHRGAMRQLAFVAAHDTLIEQLQIALGRELVIETVSATADVTSSHQAALDTYLTSGFALTDSEDTVLASGRLGLPRSVAVHVARRVVHTPVQRTSSLPLRFQIEIDRFDLPANALSDLAEGCVIRLTNLSLTEPSASVSLAAGRWRLPADAHGRSMQLQRIDPLPTHPIPTFLAGDKLMSESTSDSASDIANLASLPVQLHFSAGDITLSMAEAQSLQPGQTIALERDLAQSPISVYANDVALARGELVLIGDVLGVRITRTLNAQD